MMDIADDKDDKVPTLKDMFLPAAKIPRRKGLKIALYGKPKTRKTSSIFKWKQPVFVIDTELGTRELLDLYPKDKGYRLAVFETYMSQDEHDFDAILALKNLEDALMRINRELKKGTPIGTVAVDTMGDVWSWCQQWMFIECLGIPPEKVNSTTIRKLSKDKEIGAEDWNRASQKYKNYCMRLISLPCHVFVTAQAFQQYAKAGSPIEGEYKPNWQKQTGFWFPMLMVTEKVGPLKNRKFRQTIEDCKYTEKMIGQEFFNLNWKQMQERMKEVAGLDFE